MRMRIPKIVEESIEKSGGLEDISRKIPSGRRMNAIGAIFQSLSDPTRLSILYALSASPLCVCVVKSLLKIADPKLSYHLENLRSAGLVAKQHEGKFIIYKITDLGIMLLSACSSIG